MAVDHLPLLALAGMHAATDQEDPLKYSTSYVLTLVVAVASIWGHAALAHPGHVAVEKDGHIHTGEFGLLALAIVVSAAVIAWRVWARRP